MARTQKEKPNALVSAREFIRDVYAEGKKITWPGADDTTKWTILVLLSTMFIAVFLGAIDLLGMYLIHLGVLG